MQRCRHRHEIANKKEKIVANFFKTPCNINVNIFQAKIQAYYLYTIELQ